MANIIASTLERRVFESADGRILGTEYRIDTWFEPFTDGETATTETVVATAGPFYDMAEAGRWVDELRARQDVESAAKFEDRVRNDPELRLALCGGSKSALQRWDVEIDAYEMAKTQAEIQNLPEQAS